MAEVPNDTFADRRETAIAGQPVVDPADWTATEMAATDDLSLIHI